MMESILKWRLSPTLANRIAILEPHQPTQLQHSTSNYPLSIDLVCWPSIRDQLIFLLGNQAIDLEEILEDLFVSTVIEQPELGASANPYDIFLTHILPAIRSEEKSHEIEDDGTRENTPPINMSGIPNRTRPSIRIQQLALQYGLYSKHAWKIDIWFQDKYPFIDCSLSMISLSYDISLRACLTNIPHHSSFNLSSSSGYTTFHDFMILVLKIGGYMSCFQRVEAG
jgi:hypothetical protein